MTQETRLGHLEAAHLQLFDRIVDLEQRLAFEIAQRVALEEIILKLSTMAERVDRLERQSYSAPRRRR